VQHRWWKHRATAADRFAHRNYVSAERRLAAFDKAGHRSPVEVALPLAPKIPLVIAPPATMLVVLRERLLLDRPVRVRRTI
jgi:hypothetical protein